MTDRIKCKNPDCPNTIQPATAERTGGFCMPCVQAAERKEREEYIEKNRRDVDEFAGVTDPVEVLQIIHKDRDYDPLVNWISYSEPTDQVYAELGADDQRRMVECATSLLGSEQNDEGESILLCLAAFTDAPVEKCLRKLTDLGSFWPSFPFHRSPPELRDELIARVEGDADNRAHLLCALAWIGDDAVVALFDKWRKQPPAWADEFRSPPYEYAHQAGWELTDDGRRRDLYFAQCTRLVKGPSTLPEAFKAITPREDECPWCGLKLTTLIDVDPSHFRISSGDSPLSRVHVVTCEVCTAFGTVYGRLDAGGTAQWAPENTRPDYLPDDGATWERLPQDALNPDAPRPPLFAADQFLPTTFSQLGGHPTWIQDAEYPKCPACTKTMMFLAQFDHADIEEGTEGLFYAFLCPDCGMTATGYQQT